MVATNASLGRYQKHFLSLSLQSAVDGRATNAERLGNLGWSHALCLELLHLGGINRCRAALVDAGSLGLGDAFHLSLFAQVGLELREHAEHVEEALARRGAGIDRLLSGLQRGALRLHGPNDILSAPGPFH